MSSMFLPTTTSAMPPANLPWYFSDGPLVWLVSTDTDLMTLFDRVTVTPTFCGPPGEM